MTGSSSDAHRQHRGAAAIESHRRVLAATGGGPEVVVAALADLRELRAAIDRTELDLLASARRHRVSWGRIAAALGLRSRQAAEQRAARLADQPDVTNEPVCQHCIDTSPIAELRAAAREAAARMAEDPAFDGAHPRAALARTGLAAAADASPGSLYTLAGHAVDDLSAVDFDVRPVLVRVAVTRLRDAYRAAMPVN